MAANPDFECFEDGLVERLTLKYAQLDVPALAKHISEKHWLRPLASPSGYLIGACKRAAEDGREWHRGARQEQRTAAQAQREREARARERAIAEAAPPDAGAFWASVVASVRRGAKPHEVARAINAVDATGAEWIGAAARSLALACGGSASWQDVARALADDLPAEPPAALAEAWEQTEAAPTW